MTQREVRVVPWNPAWTRMAEEEARVLNAALGEEVFAVHHIGSTAIPSISAKPTIDFLVEVRRIEAVDDLSGAMAERGYEAWGEYGLPGRRYFVKNDEERRTHNVHVYQRGNLEVERHLAFRDFMRSHPEDAKVYGALKEDLAREFPTDLESYMDGKDAFVKEMERAALSWRRSRS